MNVDDGSWSNQHPRAMGYLFHHSWSPVRWWRQRPQVIHKLNDHRNLQFFRTQWLSIATSIAINTEKGWKRMLLTVSSMDSYPRLCRWSGWGSRTAIFAAATAAACCEPPPKSASASLPWENYQEPPSFDQPSIIHHYQPITNKVQVPRGNISTIDFSCCAVSTRNTFSMCPPSKSVEVCHGRAVSSGEISNHQLGCVSFLHRSSPAIATIHKHLQALKMSLLPFNVFFALRRDHMKSSASNSYGWPIEVDWWDSMGHGWEVSKSLSKLAAQSWSFRWNSYHTWV